MRNCFVRNCDSLSRNMVKRMMFQPPKDETLFAQWRDALPKKRPFKRSDRVCERHFEKDDILTTWDHNINGVLHRLERGKAKLKPNSVPRLNLGDKCNIIGPDQSSAISHFKIRENRKQRISIVTYIQATDKNEQHTEAVSADDDIVVASNAPPVATSQYKRKTSLRPAPVEPLQQPREEVEEEEEDEVKKTHAEQVSVIESVAITDDSAKEDADDSSFEFIFDDVYEVVLPCTMYGIHRDPGRKFIVFSRFDVETMAVTKALYVNHRLQAKIFIHNVNILCERLPELTVELLTNMLSQLDAQKLCNAYGEAASNCNVVAMDGADYCDACAV